MCSNVVLPMNQVHVPKWKERHVIFNPDSHSSDEVIAITCLGCALCSGHLHLVHMTSREEPQPWSGGYQACPARGRLQEPPPTEAGARSHEVTFPHGQDRREGSPCCSTWVSLRASVSCGQGGIGLEVLHSECVQLCKPVIDISVMSETGSFGKRCHKKRVVSYQNVFWSWTR